MCEWSGFESWVYPVIDVMKFKIEHTICTLCLFMNLAKNWEPSCFVGQHLGGCIPAVLIVLTSIQFDDK